jgi:hypothetical protein
VIIYHTPLPELSIETPRGELLPSEKLSIQIFNSSVEQLLGFEKSADVKT